MLTVFQRRKVLELFRWLDSTRDGTIEFADFAAQAERIRAMAGWDEQDPRYQHLVASMRRLWAEFQDRIDSDADGEVTLDEWLGFFNLASVQSRVVGGAPHWLQSVAQALFEVIDGDGDGLIGQEDYALYLRSLGIEEGSSESFALLDGDGDGFITPQEFQRAFALWALSRDPTESQNYFLTGRPRAEV
ncbi:MAG TPA: EF-hand domain-containing protein [Candidatus Nitrosotenuis sp.]|nr:EF-hand domain-containing protein [Candidatus Nitrosotenuis sp.]